MFSPCTSLRPHTFHDMESFLNSYYLYHVTDKCPVWNCYKYHKISISVDMSVRALHV